MKGKIGKNGQLLIYRKEGYVVGICPIEVNTVRIIYCQQSCALFGEPVLKTPQKTSKSDNPCSATYLELCHKTWVFDEFVDER